MTLFIFCRQQIGLPLLLSPFAKGAQVGRIQNLIRRPRLLLGASYAPLFSPDYKMVLSLQILNQGDQTASFVKN
jgi:hypothetical protein